MPSTWRLLETFDVSPTYAMGLDEALLRSVSTEQRSVPTLRLYTWRPDAISLGYFQAFEDVPAAKEHAHVVRRLTGGGAIHHHGEELTFSITLGGDDPAYAGSVPASYERTHRAIIAALRSIGVPDVRMRRDEASCSDVRETGMCFHESTAQDISWTVGGLREGLSEGLRKGVGTAQRRTGGRILHHGSIKVDGSPLESGVATVSSVVPGATVETVAAALKQAIAEEFAVTLQASAPTAEESARAVKFGRRYVEPAFIHRRLKARSRR